MDAPAISVILPTYNGSRYLAQSIESCINQTFRNFELIIVDDASTDQTARIIAEASATDNRIRSVRHASNKKLPASLNTGMAMARGQYLTWTSDDNLFRNNALSEMAAALDCDPDLAMVYASATLIDSDGRPAGELIVGPPDHLAFTNVVGACFLYRRKVFETIGGYDENLFLVEDWDYWIRVAAKYRLSALPDDLYLYRIHQGSLTRQKAVQVWKAQLELLKRHLPDMQWASRSARSRGFLIASSIAWKLGMRRSAGRLIGQSIVIAPVYAFFRIVRQIAKRSLGVESFYFPKVSLNH